MSRSEAGLHAAMDTSGVASAGSKQEPQPLFLLEPVTFCQCKSRLRVRPHSRMGVGFLFAGQFEWGL